MTYSCALWQEDDRTDSLEAAQRRKIDYHIDQARARGAKRVLDVGCGWGSVLQRLVRVHGVERATGLTLSKTQAEHIASWHDPRIQVHLESWTDHQPAAPYDAVISLGAFEHFARDGWKSEEKVAAYRAFFVRCHEWLKPGGWMALQTIAFGHVDPAVVRQSPEYRFISTEIFPESQLPHLHEIVKASDGLFEVGTLRNDREHYWRTCRGWLNRLTAQGARAGALVGDEMVRRYVRYLKLSALGFSLGQNLLLRIAFRRLDEPRF
jgi:cyclopropane-fatty-acyl-phospholipid synthase